MEPPAVQTSAMTDYGNTNYMFKEGKKQKQIMILDQTMIEMQETINLCNISSKIEQLAF